MRSGAKRRTAQACEAAIRAAWPSRTILVNRTEVQRRGVASGYGHGKKVVEEIDIIATPPGTEESARAWFQIGSKDTVPVADNALSTE